MHPRRPSDDATARGSHDTRELAARRLAQIAQGMPESGGEWWDDHTRVSASTQHSADDDPPVPAPLVLPRPGRHAARPSRPVRGAGAATSPWGLTLPVLRPAHLAVVALAIALALGVTTWWVARDRPSTPPAGSALAPSRQLEPLSAQPRSGEPTAEASVTVDVAGKVRRPGIVVLDQGARVTDALSAAGGPRRGVDLTGLNLARVLVDGEQVVVGVPAPSTPGQVAAGGTPSAAAPVNLNLAAAPELEALPEVGPVTAQAIVAWREEHGGFSSVDELLEVDGIGAATLEKIAPHVTV